MHIYQLPVSLYSFKLRLALAFKGLEVELRDPPGGGYRSPEYRAINPAGTIPALVDGSLVLCESDAIIEYLDDCALGASLRSPNPVARARDRMLSRWVDMRLEPAVRLLFPHVARDRRDEAAVREADVRIAASLDLLDASLDKAGPFATGAMPGLADCGLTATLAWFDTLREPLGLKALAGPRVRRVASEAASDARTRRPVEQYKELVAAWVGQKL